ncbi:MAG: P-II family nitrogen regulator [Actinomycetia bacterium]|nr:P-II family nitrogen regulator [Actinomycetes bacterium]
MKLITCVVKPHRLDAVRAAIEGEGVGGATVTEVTGFGRQGGHTEVYRGVECEVDFVPKARIEILCDDADADRIVDAVAGVARTDRIGDGKIWVADAGPVTRIRTGELGPEAV